MSSKDLQAVVKTQKAFIKELLDRLEGKETNPDIPIKYDDYIFVNIQGTDYLLSAVKNMLNDSYFDGLSFLEILDLAKKSIRLTDDNCKMRHKLDDIKTFASMYSNDPLFKQVLDIIGEDIQELQ